MEAKQKFFLVGDICRANKCQDYIDRCNEIIQAHLRLEAESLFEEGMSAFEVEDYESAQGKFEKALVIYQELGDEKRIEECEKWITLCEEAIDSLEGGFCLGTVLILLLFLPGIVATWKRRSIGGVQPEADIVTSL